MPHDGEFNIDDDGYFTHTGAAGEFDVCEECCGDEPCTDCDGVQPNVVVTGGTCAGTFFGCPGGATGGPSTCYWIWWRDNVLHCNRSDNHLHVARLAGDNWSIDIAGGCAAFGYIISPNPSSGALTCNESGNLEGTVLLVNPVDPGDTCIATFGGP